MLVGPADDAERGIEILRRSAHQGVASDESVEIDLSAVELDPAVTMMFASSCAITPYATVVG